MRIFALGIMAVFVLAACDPDPANDVDAPPDQPAADAPLTMPDWFEVDEDAQTVHMELVSGSTSANNYWNFNGHYGGRGHVFVPVGYEVTIVLTNEDATGMAHSVGVGERQDRYPTNFAEVEPVFQGAVTPNPTSMTEATMPGDEDTITFVVDRTGEFDLICYVPGHAQAGMYLHFDVVDEGEEYGVRE